MQVAFSNTRGAFGRSRQTLGLLLLGLLSLSAATGCTAVDDLTEPSCSYNVAPASANFGAGGGPGQLAVTASGVCAWSVAAPPAWITINGSPSGSGDGRVDFTVAPNPNQVSRAATFTVATRTVTITQTGAPCTITVQPTTTSFTGQGGRGAVNVTGASTCAWTASTTISWIHIRDPQQGSGDGRVEFDVDPNPSAQGRAGTIQIGGQGVVVSQDGTSSAQPSPPSSPSCSLSLSPSSASLPAAGGTANFNVGVGDTCAWSASADQGWIRITSGGSGTGPGIIGVTVDPNPSGSARAGSVSAGGQTVAVLQNGTSGQACSYAVSPTSAAAGAAGGSGSIQVGAPGGCDWTATSNQAWLTVTSGNSGSGNGTIQYAVTPNPTTSGRTAVVTVNGATTTITQAGQTTPGPTPPPTPPPTPTCTFAIAPTSASAPALGVIGSTVQVTAPAGCAWTATSAVPWITITSGAAGSGDGTVQYSVAAHTGLTPRTGTLTIAGQTFTVTQAAAAPLPACTYTVSPTTVNLAGGREDATIQVTAAATCAWTATSSASWLTIRSGASGTGDGAVVISAAPNNSSSPRTATLTIAGQAVTVNQQADR